MKLGSWFIAFALFALLVVGVCFTYVIRGTTVIGDFVSPDGVHDAVLMVRDGGAVTGYITGISLLPHNSLARHLAFMRGNAPLLARTSRTIPENSSTALTSTGSL